MLSFFKALNPSAQYSGIYADNLIEYEIKDITVSEKIAKYRSEEFTKLSQVMAAVFDIIYGNHYQYYDNLQCSKGLIDYLIFPLIARKLLWDCELDSRKNTLIINFLAKTVGYGLQVPRLVIAVLLTALLTPTILLLNFVIKQSLALLTMINQQINPNRENDINVLAAINREDFIENNGVF